MGSDGAVSSDVVEWRYFIATHGTETAGKLNAVEEKIEQFTAQLQAFQATIPNDVDLVGFVEQASWVPELVQFGIEPKDGCAPPSATEWVETLRKGVYQPQEKTPFYEAQESLLQSLAQIPKDQFVWILGDGGDRANHPSRATIIKEEFIAEGAAVSDPLLKLTATTAEAFRLDNQDWLFRVPVNPESGECYHPPESREISLQALYKELGGKKIGDLPPLYAKRPLAGLKLYERILKY